VGSPKFPPPDAAEAPPRASVAAIILAAGGSLRMGVPKQLLRFQGISLLRRAAQTAIAAELHPTLVVLGAHAELLAPELSGMPVQIVTNSHWSRGIGTSIRAAVAALPANIEALVILLADQPLVSPGLLRSLIAEHRSTAAPIVASAYRNTLGVPALFSRICFDSLARLPDESGAKVLIADAGTAARAVPFPDAAFDIDTPADATILQKI
jgi:molybdenum cofactor cytidylyltransferase